MRSRYLAFALLASCTTPTTFTDGGPPISAVVGEQALYTFDEDPAGTLPDRFISPIGDWKIRDGGLAQEGDFKSGDYPRVILKSLTFGDLDLSVRCRPERGSTDQACGVMFHLEDSDNYLVTRANALEDNVRLYRVVKGDRQQFASADVGIDPNVWHELAVSVRGDEIAVSWNGQELIRQRDSTFGAGKIGLWTKADSITLFDDLKVTAR